MIPSTPLNPGQINILCAQARLNPWDLLSVLPPPPHSLGSTAPDELARLWEDMYFALLAHLPEGSIKGPAFELFQTLTRMSLEGRDARKSSHLILALATSSIADEGTPSMAQLLLCEYSRKFGASKTIEVAQEMGYELLKKHMDNANEHLVQALESIAPLAGPGFPEKLMDSWSKLAVEPDQYFEFLDMDADQFVWDAFEAIQKLGGSINTALSQALFWDAVFNRGDEDQARQLDKVVQALVLKGADYTKVDPDVWDLDAEMREHVEKHPIVRSVRLTRISSLGSGLNPRSRPPMKM